MIKPVVLAALLGVSLAAVEDHWAVIVAGSNGFWNYRHQADVCHSYQIMKKHGIKEDHIILFAYDDVANSSSNPFPGKIFNKPDGEDVYAGCNITYKGADVTPENFLAVLTGDSTTTGGKPVLQSNEKSKVFVNFADHGAPGLIAFPSEYLYADKLNDAINTMHEQKMYEKLTIYIEACESGSMFPNLKSDIGVYATTAANGSESSWGTYCYPNDVVEGKHINSCLGDLYSVNWMEDSDAATPSETLDAQFKTILAETTKSHPQKFGDFSFTKESIFEFQGDKDDTTKLKKQAPLKEGKKESGVEISSRDAKFHHLYAKALEHPTHKNNLELQQEINHRMETDLAFQQFASIALLDTEKEVTVTDYGCLRAMINTYESQCSHGKMSDYELKYVKYFVNACENLVHPDLALHALKKTCTQ
jgi:legumain